MDPVLQLRRASCHEGALSFYLPAFDLTVSVHVQSWFQCLFMQP